MLNERRKRPNRKRPPQKIVSTLGTIKTKGKHGGEHSVDTMPRLVDTRGEPQTTAKYILGKHTQGTKGKLPDHTVYHDIGYLMAESLGLVSEEEYNSDRELRAELDALARRTGKNSGDDVIIKGPGVAPKPPSKPNKIVIRRKKKATKKKSKPPTDRKIAQRWRGPDASPLGG